MKLIGGLVDYDMISSSLHLPYSIRAPLGLEVGASVYFSSFPPQTNTNKKLQILHVILSPIKPHFWNVLQKLYVTFFPDQPGLVYHLVDFLENINIDIFFDIDIFFEESISTLDLKHEVTLITGCSSIKPDDSNKESGENEKQVKDKLEKLRKKIEKHFLNDVLSTKVKEVTLKFLPMDFLTKAYNHLPDEVKKGKEIEDYHEIILGKGKVTIPRHLIAGVKPHRAIVFCDTEEKYIGITLLDESVDSLWLDIIHTEQQENIRIITIEELTLMSFWISAMQIQYLKKDTYQTVFEKYCFMSSKVIISY